ncbi:sulfite exporter TauE/SafE family protein [Candidatus Woesearchaeota archaeon]|nr:sulfite exporter TauE/SafE family protein [Candidatus Woesearchaeota archaeon]
MEPIFTGIFIFIVGLIASFVGTIGAGSGLISIPALIFIGIPPHLAIATNKFGMFGMKTGGLQVYIRHKKILWPYVIPFTLIGIIGAVLGAKLLLDIDESILSKVIGISLIAIAAIMFFNKKLGVLYEKVSKRMKIIGYSLYFLSTIWSSFFSAGSGFFRGFINMTFFKFTIIQSKATTKIPMIIADIVTISIFAFAGIIDYIYGIILLVGMYLGSFTGAHVNIQKGEQWVKNIYLAFVIIFAVQILFFS